MRYADPALCPDCRSPLPAGVPVCPTCQLLVRHPQAVDLFRTLQRADAQVAELRVTSNEFHGGASGAPAPVTPATHATRTRAATPAPPSPGPARPAVSPAPPVLPPAVPHRNPAFPPAPRRSGVASASVPKILLGLGALCLLVAAIIFLAVSWSALGVGGRTAVLSGLTLTAGALALTLHRIELRIAGESLIVVALGLLTLDIFGAGAAGWLGDGEAGGVALVAGLVVAAAGLGLGLLRIGGQPRLVAPQVIAGVAVLVGYVGALDLTGHDQVVGHTFTALAIGIAILGRVQKAAVLQWSLVVAGTLIWLATAAIALTDALIDPNLHQLWADGSGWSLLLSAAVLFVPGVVTRHHPTLLAGASCAAMLVTVVLTLPSVDTDAATFGLVAAGATTVWVLLFALLPHAYRTVAVAPSAVGSLILLAMSLVTGAVALTRWAERSEAFERDLGLLVGGPDPVTEPLLLIPSLLVPLAFLALLVTGRHWEKFTGWLLAGAATAAIGLAVTLMSYDVVLALPIAVLALVATGATVTGLLSTGARATGCGVAAVLIGAVASIGAVPSAPLCAIIAVLTTLLAVALAVRGTVAVRVIGGLAAAPFLAIAVAAVVYSVDGGAGWVAIPVLLAVGVLALALPRLEVELPAVAAAVLVYPASLDVTADPGGYTALWLTVAGFLACATALVHESRRFALWIGGALLFLATWVRLADLEVKEPEAYTLPLALALLAFGLWRMQRSHAVGTAEALLPGLLLGTIPSLLWVLGDPVSIRALILGAACLALTIAGAIQRWSAPLVVGATVGAIIVFREIGPYAGDFPKWVWIGLAGALLTAVGITWERQLLEVRKAVGYLGRLR